MENLPQRGNHAAQLADPRDSHLHLQGRREKQAGELQACLFNKSSDQNLWRRSSGRTHGAEPSVQYYALSGEHTNLEKQIILHKNVLQQTSKREV